MRQPLVLDAVKAPQIDSDVIPVLRHIEPRAVVHARKQPPADHRVQSRRSVAPGNELPPPNASIRVPFDRDAVRGVLRPETEKRR